MSREENEIRAVLEFVSSKTFFTQHSRALLITIEPDRRP